MLLCCEASADWAQNILSRREFLCIFLFFSFAHFSFLFFEPAKRKMKKKKKKKKKAKVPIKKKIKSFSILSQYGADASYHRAAFILYGSVAASPGLLLARRRVPDPRWWTDFFPVTAFLYALSFVIPHLLPFGLARVPLFFKPYRLFYFTKYA